MPDQTGDQTVTVTAGQQVPRLTAIHTMEALEIEGYLHVPAAVVHHALLGGHLGHQVHLGGVERLLGDEGWSRGAAVLVL